jgi:glutamine synthetase
MDLANPTLSLPFMNHAPYERVTGEVQFYPDAESPRRLPWLEGAAIVFGRFHDAGKPWECCPRSFLIAQEQKLESLDVKIRIGFEIEFYLLNLDGSPVDSTGYGEPQAFHGKTWKVICSVISAMKKLKFRSGNIMGKPEWTV